MIQLGYQDLHVQQMEVYKIKLEEYHAGLKATTQAIENTTSDQELATDLMSDLFNGEISIDEMDIDAV